MDRRYFLGGLAAFSATPALARAAVAPFPAITDYEAASGGHVGVYAQNLRTGRVLAWRADERFVMCSTFKASLAACVLSRVDRGQMHLEEVIAYTAADVPDWHAPVARAHLVGGKGKMTVRQMCAAAVEESDNTCANQLLARLGGPGVLTAFWRALGDGVSRLDAAEPVLNRTPPGGVESTTTPMAMAQTLRKLVLGRVLSPASGVLLRDWLIGCKTGANRLRAGLPGGWTIGDKTGNNGLDASGDIAVVWPAPDRPILIAAYTRGGTPGDLQLDTLFAGIGRAVAARLA